VSGERIGGGAMLPGAGPIGVNEAFEAAGGVRFEGEALVLGGEKIATNPLDGGGMRLLRVVAEAGALLDSHGKVGSNHGLEITEAADDGAIIPGVGVGRSVRVTVEEVTVIGRGVVKFDIGGGRVKTNHA